MLKVNQLHQYYGGSHILRNVNIQAEVGKVTVLLGRNGVGKTTLLKSLMGLVPIKSGSIEWQGKDIARQTPYERARSGIGYVPQGRRLFGPLTVAENLDIGLMTRRKGAATRDHVLDLFPRLRERLSQPARTLSGGEQQMLAIGRGLMSQPRLMLLDEPSMGLAPLLVKEIFSIIKEINASGTTILLVEQNAHMALSIAHHAYVLETGRITLSGTAKELSESEAVRKAYLGG